MQRHENDYNVLIKRVSSLDEIEGDWSRKDYIILLDELSIDGVEESSDKELRELLMMALSELDVPEAAKILLTYKCGEELTEGQIEQIAHDMQNDKICEEYPEISLHHTLFSINQLLFVSYNGKVPNCKATKIVATIDPVIPDSEHRNELVLRILVQGLSDSNVINRLFDESLTSEFTFKEGNYILWAIKSGNDGMLEIYTSEYWIEKDDVVMQEYTAKVPALKDEEKEED